MNKVSSKLILLLILAALVPMTLFGIVSIYSARETTRELVIEENLEIAKRAAHQIEQYINNSQHILKSLAQNLGKTDLLPWQKERFVRNHVIEFEEFYSIDLTHRSGKIIATSRLDNVSEISPDHEAFQTALSGEIYRSRVFISKNFTPAMIVAVPVISLGEIEGTLIGELNLIEMWRLVDSIRIGEEGVSLVISADGSLIAHGLGAEKGRVFRQEKVSDLPFSGGVREGKTEGMIYVDGRGIELIGVSAPVQTLGWQLIIEQPTREAYAAANRLTKQLTLLVLLFLFLMIGIGMLGGRRYIVTPIRELIRGTRSVGGGNLSDKVNILTHDEFRELGDAFNLMTENLTTLKEDIRKKERAAMLGRIASGLVHDLRHPIKNLENSSRLVTRFYDNQKTRDLFQKMVDREFPNLNRLLDDLLHLAHSNPIKPILFDLSRFMTDILEPFCLNSQCVIQGRDRKALDTQTGETIFVFIQIEPQDLKIWADRFALERIVRNLIANAIEAMNQGGTLDINAKTISPKSSDHMMTEITISDTGSGISPERLSNLFVDYTTTKQKGIGLGLAICKKIIEEHKAVIHVESIVDQGTIFTLQFPFPKE